MKKRSLGNALRAAALAAVVLLGACVDDGDEVIALDEPTPSGGQLFVRYVSLGNSITAGLQSAGINDSLQVRAYPVLLAERAGGTFNAPLVARPGCPRPFAGPFQARIGTADSCVRINDPRVVNNVAVPGVRIRDLTRFPGGDLGRLYTLLVGSRTQARAMIEARPTFVSVWVGNNDALEATLGGVLGPLSAGADSSLTSEASFQASLNLLVDSIKVAAPQGAMLVGVVNAIQGAPLIQPGAYFWAVAQNTNGLFSGKPVNNNCAPINLATGAANPLSANMVSFQIVTDNRFPEINCSPTAQGGVFLLDTQEQAVVAARVNRFNEMIAAAAQANNWLYVNPNEILLPFLAERNAAGLAQRLRKCQGLAGAATLDQLRAAVATTCPVTGQTAAPNFFGSLMSFDGVHPSTEAHRVLAGAFAQRINTKYGTTLSTATN